MLCLFFLTNFVVLTNSIGEPCATPFGQNGKCTLLAYCESMLWSLGNPKRGTVDYLDNFLCSKKVDEGITVCCSDSTDNLVFENEEDTWDPNSVNHIKELVNEGNCGIQSDSVASDGLIGLYNFPWLVKLVMRNNSFNDKDVINKVACTGVLINERLVVYSAQCHVLVLLKEPQNFVRIDFYTGNGSNCDTASSSYTTNCSNYENYEIDDVFLHPYYDRVIKINDLIFVRLNRRVQFSEFVKPICLPLTINLPQSGLVHISGWNRTYLQKDSAVKRTYTSVVIPNYECKNKYKLDDVLTTFDMCSVNGTPPGDEVIGYPVTMFYQSRWYIVGFTSRGKEPRIHTRMQNYLQWIKESIGEERCLTPFNETGECIQITECSRLNRAFANAGPQEEDHLKKFVCELPDEYEAEEDISLKVCCGYSSNFTIFEKVIVDEPNLLNISDYRFCGLQHRDDYFTTDDKLAVDEFPWLAAIINGSLPSQRVCGGSLITAYYVLTSTQCLRSFNENDTILVRLGEYNLKTESDCLETLGLTYTECADVQEHEIESKKEHPFYNIYQLLNDIGLVRLKNRVTFSDHVRPICLPKSEDDYFCYGETMYTTGFGDNLRNVTGPSIKKKILTTLISLNECNQKAKTFAANPIIDNEFCTEDSKNSSESTCVGDEGGPVMYSKKYQWFILGLSSAYGCHDEEPQIHLKVFPYLRWIKLNMKN